MLLTPETPFSPLLSLLLPFPFRLLLPRDWPWRRDSTKPSNAQKSVACILPHRESIGYFFGKLNIYILVKASPCYAGQGAAASSTEGGEGKRGRKKGAALAEKEEEGIF